MPQTVTLTAYTFDELDDSAKEAAREWFRSVQLDYDWWDFTTDDAKRLGKTLGIEIDDIYFSGFSSQGDGACFTGQYSYRPDWREVLDQECGGDDLVRLTEIGETLEKNRVLCGDDGEIEEYVWVRKAGRYSHEYSVSIESESEEIKDALRDFMRWTYSRLRAEYEWLQSDEQVDETIRANEYLFTAEGRRHAVL